MRKFTALMLAGIGVLSLASPAAAAPDTIRGSFGLNGKYGSATLEYSKADGWIGHMRIEKLTSGGYHLIIATGISTDGNTSIDTNLKMTFACYVEVTSTGRFSCRRTHMELPLFSQYPDEFLDMSRINEPGFRATAYLFPPNGAPWMEADLGFIG